MVSRLAVLLGCAAVVTCAHAAEDVAVQASAASAPEKTWSFSLTAYPTDVRGGDNYTSAIALADRGPLHLEARYNYESVGARSVYVGWAFAGGDALSWSVTPIVGGAWGTTQSFIAGFEASASWRTLDFYVEAEYVPTSSRDDSYTYAWSELGWRPVEWLRLGAVGQRTRTYGSGREFQRGPFAQITWKAVTIGAYWFNPGASEQVVVGMVAVKF